MDKPDFGRESLRLYMLHEGARLAAPSLNESQPYRGGHRISPPCLDHVAQELGMGAEQTRTVQSIVRERTCSRLHRVDDAPGSTLGKGIPEGQIETQA
jgi:hypothetical protein